MTKDPYSPEMMDVYQVVREGSPADFQNLLKSSPQLIPEWGSKLLTYAVGQKRNDLVPEIVAAGVDVNARDHSGDTPLFQAAYENDVDLATWLLDRGADPNLRTKGDEPDDTLPLAMACYKGNLEVVKVLIARGADPALKCWDPLQNCLQIAKEENKRDIVEYLKSLGMGGKEKPKSAAAEKLSVLRTKIQEAARIAFTAMRTARPDETFYVYALYSDGDASTVVPAACTEEAYERILAKYASPSKFTQEVLDKHGISYDDYKGTYRWSTGEWPYTGGESDAADEVYALINDEDAYDEDEDDGFLKFKALVYAAMVLALDDLDDEGFFGEGKQRSAVTLLCDVSDSSDGLWLAHESARALNRVNVFDHFSSQYFACRSKDERNQLMRPKKFPLYVPFKKLLDKNK